jgi:hypothetical protein
MRYGTIDLEYAHFLSNVEPQADGPILMVNLMKYRPVAEYEKGSPLAASGAISGRTADDLYSPLDVFGEIGAEVALYGNVIGGPHGASWDRVAIVCYPTRRSFIDMQSRRDFRDKHQHKEAGMAFTIIVGCSPLAQSTADLTGPTRRLRLLSDTGGEPEEPHRPPARGHRLIVEGTIVGDERRWSGVEITEATTETGDTRSSGVVVDIDIEIEIVHDRLDEVITGREWTGGSAEASVA